MFLIRIIRFITGYVIFRGTGGFPERFLNLCSRNGITLWDAKSSGGTLTAKTSIACYKRIRLCARRSGMRIRITKKRGLPFIINPYKKRKGLAVGIALSVLLIVFLNSTVWTINVTGNEKFTDEQIIAIAEGYGIRPGAFRKNIDVVKIREDIKANVSGISWFSVNIDGGNVSLEVSESSGEREILDLNDPCNIISGVDGEVLKIDAYTGTGEVSPGSAVIKGDLLISGIVEKNDGSARFVHARGNAVIRTNRCITCETPLNIECSETFLTGKRYTLCLFGLKIPLGFRKTADTIRREEAMLSYRDTSLPAGIITESYYSIAVTDKNLSVDAASLLCGYAAFGTEMTIMKNAETESKKAEITVNESGVSFEISYINHETTGIEQFFEVENN